MTIVNNLLIHTYLKKNNTDKDLNKNLYKLGIIKKDYPNNLSILYNKFNYDNKSPIEQECRSLIVNSKTLDLICFTCPTPIYNINAMNFLIKNSQKDKEIYECYEGSLLSVFYFEDKWYVASRKCININNENKNKHLEMFEDVLDSSGYDSFENFSNCLDKDKSYYFVLIHHKNKNIVDYSETFGENYKKLCLVFIRNSKDQKELDLATCNLKFLSENIFLSKKLKDESTFDEVNKINNISEIPKSEGIIIKVENNILKLQSLNYQFYNCIGADENIFRGLIKLYQMDNLNDYLNKHTKFQTINNSKNESFETIGIISGIFKVLTNELLNLFNFLWDSSNMKHKNSDLYNKLPNIYKKHLYNLRGIYFKNKNNLNSSLVFRYLKQTNCTEIEYLLKNRKLMINWTINSSNDPIRNNFLNTLYNSKKIIYRLTDLYTTKLFPEIGVADVP